MGKDRYGHVDCAPISIYTYEETDFSLISTSLSWIYLASWSMPSLLGGAIPTSRAFRVNPEPQWWLKAPKKKEMWRSQRFRAMVSFATMIISANIELITTYVGLGLWQKILSKSC